MRVGWGAVADMRVGRGGFRWGGGDEEAAPFAVRVPVIVGLRLIMTAYMLS